MRSDFSKVVTERPRTGSRWCGYWQVRDRSPIGEDDVGIHEGMKRPHGRGHTKEFTDVLGPLYRFLQNRVGQKWDKVHSEICANLKGRNTQQQHVLDHLYRYVERYVEINADGELISKGSQRYRSPGVLYSDFYVDPRNGILKRTPKRKYVREKPPATEFIKNDKAYKLIDGIWFETWTETITDSYRSVPSGELVYYTKNSERKRQLSAKELRMLKIENEYDGD